MQSTHAATHQLKEREEHAVSNPKHAHSTGESDMYYVYRLYIQVQYVHVCLYLDSPSGVRGEWDGSRQQNSWRLHLQHIGLGIRNVIKRSIFIPF